jgi:hypothetical protein
MEIQIEDLLSIQKWRLWIDLRLLNIAVFIPDGFYTFLLSLFLRGIGFDTERTETLFRNGSTVKD